MTKQKLSEQQLLDAVTRLREKTKAAQLNEEGFIDALGNFVKGGANLAGNVAGNVVSGAQGVANAAGNAYNAVKTGVGNAVDAAGNAISGAVAPVVQAAQSGYNTGAGNKPAAPTQATKPKPNTPAQATKPAAPAAAKPDPNVKALQDKLIAAGAKIKADGIMGPATRAAQAQFPNVTTQTDAEKAVAADINSADKAPAELKPTGPFTKPMAPAATNATANTTGGPANMGGVQATADDAGNTTITRPDGSTMVVGPDGKQVMPGSNPNLPQNKGVVNTVKNAVQGTGDFQKPAGFIQPAAQPPATPGGYGHYGESSGYDEVQRLVSLVQYR